MPEENQPFATVVMPIRNEAVFIPIGGHAEVPADFIKNSVRCLAEHPDVWVAGGHY